MTPQQVLKQVFGYDSFRPQQEAIVHHLLSGKDAFVLMPTGGGKSICFQVPALVLPGITIVISPLISLMQDQVETLRANGVKAAFYNSTQSGTTRNTIVQECQLEQIKLLYLAPETYLPALESWLKDCNISLIAIDEAHCVSSWGHDFRPEYTQLGPTRSYFPEVPMVALTATADKVTRKDIVAQLNLQQPEVFISSFDRPNIQLTVRGNLKKKEKLNEIRALIGEHEGESGIIYCLSRKETEALAKELRQFGLNTAAYHAGMTSVERERIQQQFITDEIPIICATIAFGMGIDKPNVRWVIHNNLPKNIESYYQEIGRAGRDGLDAQAILYFTARDAILHHNFINEGENSIVARKKLQRMQQFSEATSCRRKILLQYFNETLEEDCGNCDICLHPPDFIDGTIIAQKALSAIKRTNERISTTMLIKILRGSESADVIRRGFHHIKTYGVGAEYTEQQWQHYIAQLLNLHLLEIDYEQFLNLKITPNGWNVLKGIDPVRLTTPPVKKQAANSRKKTTATGATNHQLLGALKALRLELARQRNVPAYIVFNDATLQDMVVQQPTNLTELSAVKGIGAAKLEQYGTLFLDCIAQNQPTAKEDTLEHTLRLLQEGFSIQEVAFQRGFQPGSIYQHLEKLTADGRVTDVSNYISEDEITRVVEVFEMMEEKGKLKPIFEALNGTVPYEKIRLALSIHQQKSK